MTNKMRIVAVDCRGHQQMEGRKIILKEMSGKKKNGVCVGGGSQSHLQGPQIKSNEN